MSRFCTNCHKKIGAFENTLSYDKDSFTFCQECFERFKEPIFLLKQAKTPQKVWTQLNTQKPFLLSTGMSEEAFLCVEGYFNKEIGDLSKIEEARIKREQEKAALIASYMLTTGYAFEGYQIKEYFGIVNSHIVMGTGFLSEMSASISDFLGEADSMFAEKMDRAKEKAIYSLIEKSSKKGGNALIGVDFDYVIFQNNLIGLSANGTSVLIQKIDNEGSQDTKKIKLPIMW